MLKKVSMKETEIILKNGGKVERNACGQYLVKEKYTRENHPEWFIACKESFTETYVTIGYIQYACYKKVLEKLRA